MLKANDSMAKNAVKNSQRFLSYLEKHRIFELFQELSTMLLVKKPDDHLLFLKQSIYHAARRLDSPRIIILAPPEFDKLKLSENLAQKLQIPLICLNNIVDDAGPISNSGFIVEKLRLILMNYMKINCDGWLFPDFPRTDVEARSIIRAGMLPTHVIEVTASGMRSNSSMSSEHMSRSSYYREIRGLRRVFSKSIKTVDVTNRNFDDIVGECLDLIKYRKYFNPLKIFRILLIDSIDPIRCKFLGQKVAKEFDIHHIDFNEVVEQFSLHETEFGDNLRESLRKTEFNALPPEMKIQVFELETLRKGWVLTGLVTTVDDFKHLDMTDSPPNRVIIIVPADYGGREEIQSNADCNSSEKVQLDSESEHTCTCNESIEAILHYCGESANIIKEHSDLKVLKDKIDLYLTQPPPCVPPRFIPPPPEIKLEDVEFDPDDEPCIEIFDDIREPEPVLPLV